MKFLLSSWLFKGVTRKIAAQILPSIARHEVKAETVIVKQNGGFNGVYAINKYSRSFTI